MRKQSLVVVVGILVGVFFLIFLATLINRSVKSLPRTGMHKAFLVLDFDLGNSKSEEASIFFSRYDRTSLITENEIQLSKIDGKRACEIVAIVQDLYNKADRNTTEENIIESTISQVRMTFNWGGFWNTSRFMWNTDSSYARFFPENTSSSCRFIPIDLLPPEIKENLSIAVPHGDLNRGDR